MNVTMVLSKLLNNFIHTEGETEESHLNPTLIVAMEGFSTFISFWFYVIPSVLGKYKSETFSELISLHGDRQHKNIQF